VSEAAPVLPTGALHLLSDKRLAQRAAGGDQRAFEAIYSRYHQSLYRFCLAMVGNPQDAQDALQNAMVKVLRALPGEKREIQLKPWLYRIARNESIETLRRRHDSDELEPEQAAAVGVAETAEARERLRTLLADLEQLPERQRAALVMRELSGLDFAEIGAAFGSSAAVARQTLYEARLSLRQLEAGREMRCADVMRELSDADGRVTRRREIRAHLRGCADCRAFREGIAKRHGDLAAIAPLPLAASAGLLHGALGSSGAGGAGGAGLAGSVGAGTGKVVATSAIVKSAATVAMVAVVGASAADRGGLIDLPLAGGGHGSARSAHESRATAGGDTSSGSADSAGAGAASKQRTGHGAGRGNQTTYSNPASGNGSSPTKSAAAPGGSPNSQPGANPPGGGYGRSASERHGRPEQLPAAAAHGQQTAAAHKSPHAASPPGQSASGGGKGNSSSSGGESPPPPKPPPASPKGKSETAGPPPSPPGEGPPQAQGGPPD
jgi:RNA polymerase sigma factor (sigma-70 family)